MSKTKIVEDHDIYVFHGEHGELDECVECLLSWLRSGLLPADHVTHVYTTWQEERGWYLNVVAPRTSRLEMAHERAEAFLLGDILDGS